MKPIDPRLLRHARATRIFLAGTVLLGLVGAGLVIAQAMLIADIVVGAFQHGQGLGDLRPPLVLLAAVALGRAGVSWLTELSAHRTSASVKSELRERLLVRATGLGPGWLSGQRTGSLVTLATRGIDALDDYFARYLPQLGLAVVVPMAVLARIVTDDWISAAIIVVTLPLIPLFMALIGWATQARSERQWRLLSRLSGHFLDVVAGLPTLKVFGRAKAQAESIRRVTSDYRQATLRTLRVAFLSSFALELLSTLSVALVAVDVGLRLVNGRLDLYTGLLVLVLAPEAYLPIRQVGTQFHAAAEGLAAAQEVFAVLETEIPRTGSGVPPTTPRLELAGVVVRHPGRAAAAPAGVTFTVEPGETVALVGPSGAGKSTLLDTVLGFTVPDEGHVRVGGRDLAVLDLKQWRRQIAWVPQQPWLFAGTIAENVRIARPDADDAALRAALRDAGAHEFVAALPQGAETILGEDGAGLSAGQRRRIALARAFLADRPVVLLDEPTASLDGETEATVVEAVGRLARGRTVLLVAHRPALLALADRVVDLADVETGRPVPPRLRPRLPVRPVRVRSAIAEASRAAGVAASTGPGRSGPVGGGVGTAALTRTGATAVRLSVAMRGAAPAGPGRTSGGRPGPTGAGDRAGTSAARCAGDPRPATVPREDGGSSAVPEPEARRRPLARVRAAAGPVRSRLVIALLLGAAAFLSAIGLLAVSGWLISRAAQHPPVLYLMVAITATRTFGMGRSVFRYAERLVSHDAVLRLLSGLRVSVHRRLTRVAPAGLRTARRGDLLSRLVADVDQLQDYWLRWLLPAGTAALVCAVTVAFTAWLLPAAGAVVACGLLLAGIGVPLLGGAVARRTEAALSPARGTLATRVADLLRGAGELTVAGSLLQRLREVRAADRTLTGIAAREAAVTALGGGLSALVCGLTVVGAAVVGVQAVREGRLDGVELAVVVLIPLAAFEAVTGLPLAVQYRQRARRSAERVYEVVDAPVPVAEPARPAPRPASPFPLVLMGIAARYPDGDADALRGLDLTLTPGRRVAVVGHSGAGKSTLAHVLLRFLDLRAGSYTLGGADARGLDGDTVREFVGLCAQDAHIFDSTLRENLRLARPEASEEDLRDALRGARLLDWADGLPDGLDTLVGEHGARLSGGQRQRLALARVLLADFPVLLLDEPAEHLDLPTADALTADLLSATEGRTTLLITHRLQGLEAVDEVLVLDDGAVVQRGAFGDLVAVDGPLRRLWEQEAAAGRAVPAAA